DDITSRGCHARATTPPIQPTAIGRLGEHLDSFLSLLIYRPRLLSQSLRSWIHLGKLALDLGAIKGPDGPFRPPVNGHAPLNGNSIADVYSYRICIKIFHI